MSLLMVAPGVTELASIDELVSISMLESIVVVRPTNRPGALGTQVLMDVVNAASAAGTTVMMHRSGAAVDSTADIDVRTGTGGGPDDCRAVEVGGIGLLIVRAEGSVWTIDFVSHRFVRSDRPVDRLLLVGSDWTGFEALWITQHVVRVKTIDGSYLTGHRLTRHDDRHEVLSDIA